MARVGERLLEQCGQRATPPYPSPSVHTCCPPARPRAPSPAAHAPALLPRCMAAASQQRATQRGAREGRPRARGRGAHCSDTRCSRSSSRKRPRKPFAPVSSTLVGAAGRSAAGAGRERGVSARAGRKRSMSRSAARMTAVSCPWIDSNVMPPSPSPRSMASTWRGAAARARQPPPPPPPPNVACALGGTASVRAFRPNTWYITAWRGRKLPVGACRCGPGTHGRRASRASTTCASNLGCTPK